MFTAAVYLGEHLYDLPDHVDTLVDPGLVVASAALMEGRQRDVQSGMVVAASCKTADFFPVRLDIHFTAPVIKPPVNCLF